jgi:O-6-methylguanine DNA methyltransferase
MVRKNEFIAMISIFGRKTDIGYFCAAIVDGELAALEFYDSFEEGYEDFSKRTLERFPDHKRNFDITYADQIADAINNQKSCPIPLKIIGREFQVAVWNELLKIAPGTVKMYNEIADAIGKPGSARAVGNVCGQNKIAYFIGCHRVVSVDNMGRGSYKWGMERKRLLLAREGIKI